MACITAEKIRKNLKNFEIILDDLDFSWTQKEIQKAIMMWDSNYSIKEMAKQLRPYDKECNAIDEVALLIMHLRRQKKIQKREGGLLGTR